MLIVQLTIQLFHKLSQWTDELIFTKPLVIDWFITGIPLLSTEPKGIQFKQQYSNNIIEFFGYVLNLARQVRNDDNFSSTLTWMLEWMKRESN